MPVEIVQYRVLALERGVPNSLDLVLRKLFFLAVVFFFHAETSLEHLGYYRRSANQAANRRDSHQQAFRQHLEQLVFERVFCLDAYCIILDIL